jgi:CheY-like chemotaxis protein
MTDKRLFILLADDDPEDMELLEEVIMNVRPGTDVKQFTNGKEILNFLDDCHDNALPNLIILDYNMPEMNGAEILSTLDDVRRFQPIPKLVLSTSNAEAYVSECLKNGAAGYFVKPSNMKALEVLTREMISLSSRIT